MRRRRLSDKPMGSVTVSTYEELDDLFAAFHKGNIGLLIIVGNAGIQKSKMASEGSADCQTVVITGRNSALGIYRSVYMANGKNVVLDDVDGLVETPVGRCLLKELCSTTPVKIVNWNTASHVLAAEGIPRQFSTRSKVAIVTNRFTNLESIEPIIDRGHLVFFEPDAREIHLRVAHFFWDQEVYDFVGEHINLFARQHLSMRLYVKSAELKAAQLDWRRLVLASCLTGKSLEVARLKADASFATEEERAAAFMKRTGASRATYFNQARKLPAPIAMPRVELTHTRPPEGPISELDLMGVLIARHGRIGRDWKNMQTFDSLKI